MSSTSHKLVAIDTQTLIWGVRRVGPPEMLERAKWLFDKLDQEQSQIIVPSIALSEYLCYTDKDRHAATIAGVSKRFMIMPFDVLCTSLAAELFMNGNADRPRGEPGLRTILKADCLIVATAMRHGARVFYCHDKGCRALAKSIGATWEVFDLPITSGELFD